MMQRVDECFVVGVVTVGATLDGPYQQPVGRVDVTVVIEEEMYRSGGASAGSHSGQDRLPRAFQQFRRAAQGTGGVGADIGGLRQPAAAASAVRAEVGGTGQCRHGAYRIPAAQP